MPSRCAGRGAGSPAIAAYRDAGAVVLGVSPMEDTPAERIAQLHALAELATPPRPPLKHELRGWDSNPQPIG